MNGINCAGCKSYDKQHEGGPMQKGGGDVPAHGFCRVKPPTVFMQPMLAPQQTKVLTGQAQPQGLQMIPMTVWPQVRAEEWCSQHFPNKAATSH